MDIKHIVLSGGSYNGIDMVGMIYKLKELEILKNDMLKSVYGVSAGSIVGAILLLNIEKNVIYDFIINNAVLFSLILTKYP